MRQLAIGTSTIRIRGMEGHPDGLYPNGARKNVTQRDWS